MDSQFLGMNCSYGSLQLFDIRASLLNFLRIFGKMVFIDNFCKPFITSLMACTPYSYYKPSSLSSRLSDIFPKHKSFYYFNESINNFQSKHVPTARPLYLLFPF